MVDQGLRYDKMVESALRGVVKQALREVVASGLPGDHHFYLTFRSDDSGVVISPVLRAQYPKEMTIVIQHQFWGLNVGEAEFTVTLSFGGKHERLVVPFHAIVSFADPSVKFGLQFEAMTGAEGITSGADEPASRAPKASVPVPVKPAGLPVANPAEPGASPKEPASQGAQVVALDAFRKK